MNVSLNTDLKDFVQRKVLSGEFPSEEAVVEAALKFFQHQESLILRRLIDNEFVEYCGREGDDNVAFDDVLKATSKIPGTMSQAIIEVERAERY